MTEFSLNLPAREVVNYSATGAAEDTLRRLIEASVSVNTKRAYSSRLKAFSSWCAAEGYAHSPASPAILALYIAHLVERDKTCSTIQQTLAAISAALRATTGTDDVTKNELVRRAIRGAKKTILVAPIKKSRFAFLPWTLSFLVLTVILLLDHETPL